MSYHAAGAVRVYSDHDELDWYAVPQNAGASSIRASVVVTLPQAVVPSQLKTATDNNSAEVTKAGNKVTFTANSGLDNGFEVGVQMPKGILQATPPSWQAAVDQQEQSLVDARAAQDNYNRTMRPLVDVAFFLLSLLVLIVGLILTILRWYRKGRDKPVALYSDYITDPPSNLPPGLVGTLLDESADVRDVIATIVDQGRKGNLTIQEVDQGGLFTTKDFEYARTGNNVQWPFEGMVLDALFKGGNATRLSDLKNTFYRDLPPIYNQMYNDVVRVGLFPESPQSVRARSYAGGTMLLLLAGLAFGAALFFADNVSYMMWLLPFALVPPAIVSLVVARFMPRKTDQGAEEAAKWRAFGRYLQDMQKYTNVQAAADKFQQYLPYAVAMNIERDLIRQFENVPAAMPPYYRPYGYGPVFIPTGGYYGAPYNTSGQGGPGMAPGAAPQFDPGGAMQGFSSSLAGAMQGMSDSFTQMVNSASNVLTSQPQSSGSGGGGGGGWGGGGGSFGGGGGGGGSAGAD